MAPQAPANIRVLVRVRPLNKKELTSGATGRTNVLNLDTSSNPNNSNIDFHGENSKENGSTISVNNLNDNGRRLTSSDIRAGSTSDGTGDMNNMNSSGPSKQYMFDAVHGEGSTQSEVYDSVKGIVDAVVGGYNGTIVAYGQTGSGKTHTVFGSGERGNESEAGLIHRSLRDIFEKITHAQADTRTDESVGDDIENIDPVQEQNSKTTFRGSFFEIFNERIYDLLSSDSLDKILAVREDSNGVYVEGLKEIEVINTSDAQALLARGLANRHVASTNMNRTSSRSHAIFVLSLKTEHTTAEGLRKVRNSKFTLVDLAGSERQKSTDAIGNRLKEASMINKSLLCLGHVINALVDKEHGKTRHIPFRNSKLTFLLKDTWGGNSKTCLVATVSPSGSSVGESISTLTFAQRAKLIKNNAILNEDTCGTVAALQAEVAKLRSKLQESSSTVVERIVETDISSNNDEIVTSLKRRNQRAEVTIAELEKQISDEVEIVNTLKRKVQEETMVRKFKERRLEYLQKKDRDFNNDEQVGILKAEIESLQRRIDAPSEDAITWRVAYEETREALDKKMGEGDGSYTELEEKKRLLEDTVDRLCGEKFELERKITTLTESSNETRKEIESIINEVDVLEKEMVSCQAQLDVREDQCKEYEVRATDAEAQLHKFMANSESAAEEEKRLENQVAILQASVGDYSVRVSELTGYLEKKNEDFTAMELLVNEKEKELQNAIDNLKEELIKADCSLTCKNETIQDLEKRLSSASEQNQNLSVQIKDAMCDVDSQKEKVAMMDKRIQVLAQEKDRALLVEKDTTRNEAYLTEKLESLQERVEHLSKERIDLESKLLTFKENADLSSEKLEEKQTKIQSLEAEISDMSGAHTAVAKSLESELNEVNGKFWIARDRVRALNEKIASIEAQRQLTVKRIEDETELMASNLGNEIDGLKTTLACSIKEKELLRRKMNATANKEIELKSTIELLMDAVQNADTNLEHAKRESNSAMTFVNLEWENRELQRQEQTNLVETERDELLEEIYEINEELTRIVEENMDMHGQIQQNESHIESLKREIIAVELKKQESVSSFQDTITRLSDECSRLENLKSQFEQKLEEKESEIARMADEYGDQKLALDEAYRKIQESLNSQEVLRKSYNDSTLAHEGEMRSLAKAKEDLEAEVQECKKELEKLGSIDSNRKEELLVLQGLAKQWEGNARDALSKLARSEAQLESIETEHSSFVGSKDEKLEKMEIQLLSLENECSKLNKIIETMTTSADETEVKYNSLQDRFTLLNRVKGNLEFELDTIQEDHNVLSDQVHLLGDKNLELECENERLLKIIDDMAWIERTAKNKKSNTNSFSGSTCTGTWISDTRLSFDTLTTNMDSMLEKMTTKQKESPVQSEHQDDEVADNDLDDSFDESMFLPNIEDQADPTEKTLEEPPSSKEPTSLADNAPPAESSSSVDTPTLVESVSTVNSSMNTVNKVQDRVQILNEATKDAIVTKSSVSFSTTPSKSKDYGKRRIPLSDRKNRTPLSIQSKRLKSSAKKVMSSSKKSRTNYMFINNVKLFE